MAEKNANPIMEILTLYASGICIAHMQEKCIDVSEGRRWRPRLRTSVVLSMLVLLSP
jgi:hypothetical protein